MYRESVAIFVSRIGMWLTLESTLLIAGYFEGPARLADFALLRQLVALGTGVIAAIPIAISPHVAAAHAGGIQDKVRALYLAGIRYSLILAILWAVGLLLWAPTVLGLLVGREHFLGYAVLVPLALGGLAESHAAVHGYAVWSTGRWPFARWVMAGGVLNVALGSLGCMWFAFGGLAWGAVVAQGGTMGWAQVWHALSQVELAPRAYRDGILRPALWYALAVALAGGAFRWLYATLAPAEAATAGGRPASALLALMAIALTALVAAALAWVQVLTQADRDYFLTLAGLRS
jgi:O-antigen/teichoic acid export membrane protein